MRSYLIPLFSKLATENDSDEELCHTTHESLIRNTIAALHPTKTTVRWLVQAFGSAPEAGASAVTSQADGAFQAVLAGDTERHDTLLLGALTTLLQDVDVLAQPLFLDRIAIPSVGPRIEQALHISAH